MTARSRSTRRFRGALLAVAGTWVVLTAGTAGAVTVELVSTGSQWRYQDDGSDQGSTWSDAFFDDSTWSEGGAQLGYGDGDEMTIVRCRVGWPVGQPCTGSDPRIITTYFRRSFQVADPSVFSSLTLTLLKDDGALVYLNGLEVVRSNMPAGPIGFDTQASSTSSDNEVTVHPLAPGDLVQGTNVLAVEIHQGSSSSSDISFDLGLGAVNPSLPDLVRGPYLQLATETSAIVRWRTDAATSSRVEYGDAPDNLTDFVQDLTPVTEHVVPLSGLSPGSRYFYSIGTDSGSLAGGDAEHFFDSAPVLGSTAAFRVWVIGDSGTADAQAASVRDAYQALLGGGHTDVWLMLGDNAYSSGTDTEYQDAVFNMYPSLLRNTFLWPTLGNHDALSASSSSQTGYYYEIFSLPAAGETGGPVSGTEAYYSFDHGNVHFVCLDSAGTDIGSPGGDSMLGWLQDDLSATAQEWIVAFWHHPPYSKGSHDSDSEGRLIDMREQALPILEAAGVDLVLSGHSHSYERSMLINGHYDTSDTLTPGMVIDPGDGDPAGDGAYLKLNQAQAGAVYAVAGSSGLTSGVGQHPVMTVSLNELGSLVLDVAGSRMDAVFLRENGTIQDSFTLMKAVPPGIFADGFESGDVSQWSGSLP